MDVENKLDIRIYSSNLNYIESKAKKVLDLCGDKNNTCNLQTIQKDPMHMVNLFQQKWLLVLLIINFIKKLMIYKN